MSEIDERNMNAGDRVRYVLSEFDRCCPTQGLPESVSFEKWQLRSRIVHFIHKVYNLNNFFEQEKQNKE